MGELRKYCACIYMHNGKKQKMTNNTIRRDIKRRRIVKNFEIERAFLKATTSAQNIKKADRFLAQRKLAKMQRDGSPTRIRNRCNITGRSRGITKYFGISRIKIRDLVSMGLLPGVRKSSW